MFCKIVPRYQGKRVHCSELEEIVIQHPDVQDCAAYADVCSDNIEVPAVCVVVKSGVNKDRVFSLNFFSFLDFYDILVISDTLDFCEILVISDILDCYEILAFLIF